MKLTWFVIPLFALGFCWADEEEAPVCNHCKIIREYNRSHKETDFIYYEDYLKDKAEKQGLKTEIKETPAPDSTVTPAKK